MQFEASESAVRARGDPRGSGWVAAVEVDGELHQLVETTVTVVGLRRLRDASGVQGPARRNAYATSWPVDDRSSWSGRSSSGPAPIPTARRGAGPSDRRPSHHGRR